MDIQPFQIDIPEADLVDLRDRLARTRLPPVMDAIGWDEGCDPATLDRVLDDWLHRFDWRAAERRLNAQPQFIADVDGMHVHLVHAQGKGPAPMPIVITHGWPGSFVEMGRLTSLLADPGAHGADPADAFTVVVPSLPGFGYSPAPARPGIGQREVADTWVSLMAGLGYHRFAAQGGDIGAGVSSWMALRHPDAVIGTHLNFIPGSYRPPLGAGEPPVSGEEQAFLDRSAAWTNAEGGYAHVHGTKPQSLSPALTDSPAGLLAWMLEKFHGWSGDPDRMLQGDRLDEILTNVSLYWFRASMGPAMRMYVEGRKRPMHLTSEQRSPVPFAVAHFPHELPTPPRSWVERGFNVQRWTTMRAGGHFAAMEEPEALAGDIRAFFRALR
ncbi:epoxide hydrolase [Bacillus sp. NP157]|nr:epoxide hydrolase [Bacillus sp. NP157]